MAEEKDFPKDEFSSSEMFGNREANTQQKIQNKSMMTIKATNKTKTK